MKILAIRGHETRGKEVIEILEMLGGENKHELVGNRFNSVYFIESKVIMCEHPRFIENIKWFTLEEFIEKFPYKVGDKVEVSHPDDNTGILIDEISSMKWNGNEILYGIEDLELSAEEIQPNKEEPIVLKGWSQGEMLERLSTEGFRVKATDNKEETMEDKPNLLQQLKEYFDNTPREIIEKEWHEYDKYNEISPKVNEYLEYVNNIRQPKYPKTYEDCCKVLNKTTYIGFDGLSFGEVELYKPFIKLMRCRDAYWQMDGNPTKIEEGKTYCLYYNRFLDSIEKANGIFDSNAILDFCTKEARDTFFENFKELIEECKVLL